MKFIFFKNENEEYQKINISEKNKYLYIFLGLHKYNQKELIEIINELINHKLYDFDVEHKNIFLAIHIISLILSEMKENVDVIIEYNEEN